MPITCVSNNNVKHIRINSKYENGNLVWFLDGMGSDTCPTVKDLINSYYKDKKPLIDLEKIATKLDRPLYFGCFCYILIENV